MMKLLDDRGFTLAELMIAAGILAFVLVSLLLIFINCIFLNELNRNFTLAYNAIQSKMEEVKGVGFNCLSSSCPQGCTSCFYNGYTFPINGFSASDAKGVLQIIDESSNLKRVKVRACFKSRNRVIGDDINNCQSSPAELITLIVK